MRCCVVGGGASLRELLSCWRWFIMSVAETRAERGSDREERGERSQRDKEGRGDGDDGKERRKEGNEEETREESWAAQA